jgi:hypothetical protein
MNQKKEDGHMRERHMHVCVCEYMLRERETEKGNVNLGTLGEGYLEIFVLF